MARGRPKPAFDGGKKPPYGAFLDWLDSVLGAVLDGTTLADLLRLRPYTISSTSHTVSASDIGRIGRTTSGSAVSITVSTSHGMRPGHIAYYRQAGAGQITFVESGVTIHKAETLNTRKEGAEVALRCVDATNFDLTGDVELV